MNVPLIPLKQGRRIIFIVCGTAKAQPRIKGMCRGKFAHFYTPDTADVWKGRVKAAALKAIEGKPLKNAVAIDLTFTMERPKSHYGTGRN
jgi:Holliday junction resolvase RusA-like endonuclease